MKFKIETVIPAKAGIQGLFIAFLISSGLTLSWLSYSLAEEKWQGVDETVVEKFAAEKGREARPVCPLQGDVQLFAFLGAGVIGGFAMGYIYRDQFSRKRTKDEG